MTETIYFASGVVVGAVITLVVTLRASRRTESNASETESQANQQQAQALQAVIAEVKATFAALSRDALSANTDDFLKLATVRLDKQAAQSDQTLDSKKKLIDANLEELSKKLQTLNGIIRSIEKDRNEAQGTLKGQIEKSTQATMKLYETTSQLRSALANPQRRGQWGERMAEDILKLSGLVEGINYRKQKRLEEGTIPDYTFLLPDNQCVHMDVKFPLASYLRMVESDDDHSRTTCKNQFLKDVRSRIKEVTTRQYIDPAAGTVDFVLVFIPNEQIYAFIHEHDSTILDDAMRQKVILCSPLTLYAIVAIIHQSVSAFRLERSSQQVLELLGEFRKQWDKYATSMEKMGDKIEAASKEYALLTGVRTRALDRQLDKIDALHADQQIDKA